MILRRKIFVVEVTALLAMATGVSAFTCNVCLPEVAGTKASKDAAMLVRANITRTWPDTPEEKMGECSQLEQSSKFMLECPIDDEYSACTKIYNDYWFALTCGRLTEDRSVGCFETRAGYKHCNCASALCNSPAAAPAPVSALITVLLASALKELMF